MSAVGKFLKGVVNVVKKVALPVLAVAAIVFTGGAALGLAPFAATAAGTAGWTLAGTIGSVITPVLGSGLVGTAVTGALVGAAQGAAIGGLVAGVTGGKVGKGIEMGGLTGAVTGGLMAGINYTPTPTAPLPTAPAMPTGSPVDVTAKMVQDSAANVNVGGTTYAGSAGNVPVPIPNPLRGGVPTDPGGALRAAVSEGSAGAYVPPPPTTTAAAPTASAAAPTAEAGGGGLFSKGGWAERNGALVGSTLAGVGQGLMGAGEAEALSEGAMARDEAGAARIAGNYASPGAGLFTQQPAAPRQSDAPRPSQAYSDAGARWEYDTTQRKLVLRPGQPAQPERPWQPPRNTRAMV